VAGSCERGNESSSPIKYREFLDQMRRDFSTSEGGPPSMSLPSG
jgi:hypothetical protein